MIKPESTRSARSELKVYEAGIHTSSVRMECDDSVSAVVHIFDGKQTVQFRFWASTLSCLRYCLNQWEQDTSTTPKELKDG